MSNEIAVRPAMTPMDLLQTARETNASIEQMQQLFDLQLRWEENEARKAYNQAIADFKAEGVRLVKNKHVRFSTSKGVTEYKHSTLGYVSDTVIPLLSKHGLSHTWSVLQDKQDITVSCTIAHILGHSASVSMTSAPDESGGKNKIQQVASTVTYLQRYTLLSALGLATDESDDDGRGASANKQKPEPIKENDEHAKALRACSTLEGLQAEWAAIPNTERAKYTSVKDEVKAKLMQPAEVVNA